MRTFVQLRALITEDEEQLAKLLDYEAQFDDSDPLSSNEQQQSFLELAPSESDVQVAFGGITKASLVIIVARQEVTVKFDDVAGVAIPVRPVSAADEGAALSRFQKLDQPGLVVWRGRVNSIYLSNPSTTAKARVFVALVGNAT